MEIADKCEILRNAQTVTLRNSHMAVSLDVTSGHWASLIFTPLKKEILDKDHAYTPVEVGLNQDWLPGDEEWQLVKTDCSRDAEGVHCVLCLRNADIEVYDSYTLKADRPMLARKVKVVYHGRDEKTFWGVLFRIPAITLGEDEECEVFVPGQSTLSRIPFSQQAMMEGQPPVLHDIQHRLGHGKTPFGPLDPSPDCSPGVIGIHNKKSRLSLISWFYSSEDTATMATEGFGNSLGITHHHRVEGWADVDGEYVCGTQYIALLQGDIQEALSFMGSTWSELGVITPADRTIHPGDIAIFETSALMEGGLSNFSTKLPRLRDLGVNLIYLLPIWLGTEVTNAVFMSDHLDLKWQRNRVPHRIVSHETLDPDVGTVEDVRGFISAAHSLGIRVLLDLVFHGVAPESPLVKSHPGWFQRNLNGEMFPSHYWRPSFSLDWADPEVQDYFIEFACRNVLDFDFDGYRIDAPFAKESNWAKGLSRRAGASAFGGVRFVQRLRSELKAIKPGSIILCEITGPIWDTMSDFCNDDHFLRMCLGVSRNVIKAADLQIWLSDRVTSGVPGAMRISSIENHNSTRAIPSSSAYRGSPIANALFTICCFSGGIPLIWSGQEQSQYRFYQELLDLRRSHPALRYGETNLLALADIPDVFVVIRTHPGENLVGLTNCSSRWGMVTVRLPEELSTKRVTPVWSSKSQVKPFVEHDPSAQCFRSTVEPYSSYLYHLEQ